MFPIKNCEALRSEFGSFVRSHKARNIMRLEVYSWVLVVVVCKVFKQGQQQQQQEQTRNEKNSVNAVQ